MDRTRRSISGIALDGLSARRLGVPLPVYNFLKQIVPSDLMEAAEQAVEVFPGATLIGFEKDVGGYAGADTSNSIKDKGYEF